MKRIAIIGNGGGGKTTLARSLAKKYNFPLTHVDSIQYLAGMKVRDVEETTAILKRLAEEESWLIDGFGTFDVITHRFHRADKIIFVDFPIWRNGIVFSVEHSKDFLTHKAFASHTKCP